MPHGLLLSRRSAILGAFAGYLTSSIPGAVAQVRLPIPQVDSVTIHTIVDNATFGPFLGDQRLPGLRVERGGAGGGPRMSRHALMAEFGLSILGESNVGSLTRRVMVDFGYSPEVLANNLALLRIDPDTLDSAVLSHGHLDHYGGFPGLFSRSTGRRHALPLIVGGEEAFCERVAMIGDPPPVMGTLDRRELGRAGLAVRIAPDPVIVADHAFTTGLIPLASFERAAMPTQMRPGVGCNAVSLSAGKRNVAQVADDGEHELATCYSVRDLGLVVIASCSHRGVLNSVRRAQAVSGIERVHAVVGGFHLVRPRTEEEARRTVAEFARINPAYIIPMHCTGEAFIAEALRVMPEKIIRPYVGTRFVFSAA
jgi:7,8-dihydropterin-6-yl-methyl-4-(beta-D-ribofuranosyl)aminobenzene 5'-phosphate synthase